MDEAIAARDASLEQIGARLGAATVLLEQRAATIEAQAAELRLRESRVVELERVATRLSERVVDRERELRGVRDELALLREDGEDSLRALAALAEELEQVRRQARGQATRIRLRALREAAQVSEGIAELARNPGEIRERMLETLQEAIARIGRDVEDGDEAAVGEDLPRNARQLFDGLVEVDVGPLHDFSQLVGFEDAAGGITATSQISVKRFTQGRATLEMKLDEPVALLRELESRAPFDFKVRDRRADRLVLDVDEE